MIHYYYRNFAYSVLLLVLMSLPNMVNAQELTASDSANDAYIDVSWELSKETCLTDNNGDPFFNGVYIQLLAGEQEIYSEVITDISGIGTTYSSSYRHEIGPDRNVNYTLNVFEQGPANLICDYTTSGSTTSFMAPNIELISDAVSPDSIHIRWNNPSALVDNFTLLRDGEVIANFVALGGVGEVFSYTDAYDFNNENGLENGATHEYCIETFSTLANNLMPVCGNGSTIEIGFAATDDNPTDRVRRGTICPPMLTKFKYCEMGYF